MVVAEYVIITFMLIEACHINPIDIFTKLYHQPYSFLLDNYGLDGYSYVGADPFLIIKAQNGKAEIIENSTSIVTNDFFSTLASALNDINQTEHCSLFPFQSGAVGYLGYELKNQLEKLHSKKAVEPILPDAIVCFYATIFVYDHKKKEGTILASDIPERWDRHKKLLSRERINKFRMMVEQPFKINSQTSVAKYQYFESNFTKEGYMQAVKDVQDYIASGDIYQANISQRLSMNFVGDPLVLYKNLRTINPVQFGAFLNYGNFQIISNSPERLLKTAHGIIETSPIKGTTSRGKNLKEDRILIKGLKTSHKELAEHIMIVDLERNDLGKICEYGSINVKSLQKIYTYPALHHMISTVKGRIRDNMSSIDCIKSIFPGGSVTGAPKIRAMEIIEEIEPTVRGIYTGAIGYIDFSGNIDMSMAIRTAVLKDNHLYLNVGGGIVADSIPEKEYEETILKANAFLKAMEMARYED